MLTAAGGVLLLIIVVMLLPVFGMAGMAGMTGGQGIALRPGSVPATYAALIEQAAGRCAALSPALLAAQLEAESGWNPRAVSSVGAQGIAQFMPGTWKTWGVDGNGDGQISPWDPADAIAAQARYDCALAADMARALETGRVKGALVELMLAAYNAGPGAVLGAGGIPNISETRNYVAKIMSRVGAFADSTGAGLPDGAFALRLIAAAQGQLGVPYLWGGGSFTGATASGGGRGFDCSGLVLYSVYQASNGRIKLPHFADSQTRQGTPVPLDQIQPGDVISFTKPGEATAHHVGIYLGGNSMIHAPQTGDVIKVSTLDYWKRESWRVVRYG
jgi:cell wall-associated NlpC family hydrolase